MLALNFASRTFAYKRLAKGPTRFVSAFSNFMGEYLGPVAKAHQCAQFVEVIGFAANTLYRNYISRVAEKFHPFYKQLKAEMPVKIRTAIEETIDSVNKALRIAYELVLKQPVAGKQIVPVTDASFRSAGYALMMADNSDHKIHSKWKMYAPMAIEKFLPCATQNIHLLEQKFSNTQINSSVFTHSMGNNKSQQSTWQLIYQSQVSSGQKQFYQRCGMHMTIRCNLISK